MEGNERKESDVRIEVQAEGKFNYKSMVVIFGVILAGFFIVNYFSFEETVLREQGLEKTLFCVEWSQPFEPELEDWKNRDLLWSISWNDVESGRVFMVNCLIVDFGFRFREDFNRGI